MEEFKSPVVTSAENRGGEANLDLSPEKINPENDQEHATQILGLVTNATIEECRSEKDSDSHDDTRISQMNDQERPRGLGLVTSETTTKECRGKKDTDSHEDTKIKPMNDQERVQGLGLVTSVTTKECRDEKDSYSHENMKLNSSSAVEASNLPLNNNSHGDANFDSLDPRTLEESSRGTGEENLNPPPPSLLASEQSQDSDSDPLEDEEIPSGFRFSLDVDSLILNYLLNKILNRPCPSNYVSILDELYECDGYALVIEEFAHPYNWDRIEQYYFVESKEEHKTNRIVATKEGLWVQMDFEENVWYQNRVIGFRKDRVFVWESMPPKGFEEVLYTVNEFRLNINIIPEELLNDDVRKEVDRWVACIVIKSNLDSDMD